MKPVDFYVQSHRTFWHKPLLRPIAPHTVNVAYSMAPKQPGFVPSPFQPPHTLKPMAVSLAASHSLFLRNSGPNLGGLRWGDAGGERVGAERGLKP